MPRTIVLNTCLTNEVLIEALDDAIQARQWRINALTEMMQVSDANRKLWESQIQANLDVRDDLEQLKGQIHAHDPDQPTA